MELITALVFGAVLFVVGGLSRINMQMVWIGAILLMLAASIIVPLFRVLQ